MNFATNVSIQVDKNYASYQPLVPFGAATYFGATDGVGVNGVIGVE